MAIADRHAHYSLAEYLALEAYANVKHEYLDGEIHAMAGGSPEYGAIAMRIGASLVSQLRGRGYTVYSSDVRIRIAATGLSTYPDLSVACGERRVDPLDPQAVVDPVVLVEVMSPGTEAYDRGEKLRHYRGSPPSGRCCWSPPIGPRLRSGGAPTTAGGARPSASVA